jgi:hypothetical protein
MRHGSCTWIPHQPLPVVLCGRGREDDENEDALEICREEMKEKCGKEVL